MKKLENSKIVLFEDLEQQIIKALKSYNFRKGGDMTYAFSPIRLASENIKFLKEKGHEDTDNIYTDIMSEVENGLAYLKGKKYDENNLWSGFSEQKSFKGCYKES